VERISQLEQELKERAVQVLQAKQETEVWKKGAQAVEATNSYCQQLEKENRQMGEALTLADQMAEDSSVDWRTVAELDAVGNYVLDGQAFVVAREKQRQERESAREAYLALRKEAGE
jgi:hypothetical protein